MAKTIKRHSRVRSPDGHNGKAPAHPVARDSRGRFVARAESGRGARPAAPSRRRSPSVRTTIEQLAVQQGVKPITDPDVLRGDFWPADESADEFIATVRRWRQGRGSASDR
jgi:hypothetical protein